MSKEQSPTNEQIEAEVEEHMRQLRNLSIEDLREGYRHQLLLIGFLRRALVESSLLARVVFVGPKGYFGENESKKI